MHVEILDKNDKIVFFDRINDDEDFEGIEEKAKEFDFPVCIRWERSTDGQIAYWSPRGASFRPHWYNKPGGAMPGAGAPTKPEQLKKEQIGLQLPRWMIAKLDEMKPQSRAVIIEGALIDKFGWQAPDVDC